MTDDDHRHCTEPIEINGHRIQMIYSIEAVYWDGHYIARREYLTNELQYRTILKAVAKWQQSRLPHGC